MGLIIKGPPSQGYLAIFPMNLPLTSTKSIDRYTIHGSYTWRIIPGLVRITPIYKPKKKAMDGRGPTSYQRYVLKAHPPGTGWMVNKTHQLSWLVNLPPRATYPPPEIRASFSALLRETNG